jgi:purine-nucleoside phosphorylase
VLAVEMEAAALYAFASATRKSLVCFAHVTNSMAQTEGDFEKGDADGVISTLAVITATAAGWRSGEGTSISHDPA